MRFKTLAFCTIIHFIPPKPTMRKRRKEKNYVSLSLSFTAQCTQLRTEIDLSVRFKLQNIPLHSLVRPNIPRLIPNAWSHEPWSSRGMRAEVEDGSPVSELYGWRLSDEFRCAARGTDEHVTRAGSRTSSNL